MITEEQVLLIAELRTALCYRFGLVKSECVHCTCLPKINHADSKITEQIIKDLPWSNLSESFLILDSSANRYSLILDLLEVPLPLGARFPDK